MCRDNIQPAILRLRTAIRSYYRLTFLVVVIVLVILVLTVKGPLREEKLFGTVLSLFVGLLSGFPIKEIQTRADRIVLLQLLNREYDVLVNSGVLPSSPDWAAVEIHCRQTIDRILGG